MSAKVLQGRIVIHGFSRQVIELLYTPPCFPGRSSRLGEINCRIQADMHKWSFVSVAIEFPDPVEKFRCFDTPVRPDYYTHLPTPRYPALDTDGDL